MRTRVFQIIRVIVGSVLFLLAVSLGAAGAVFGFFGSALVTNSVIGLVLAGLVVCFAATTLLAILAARMLGLSSARRRGVAVGFGTTVVAGLLALVTIFQPLSPPAVRLPLPREAGYWDLITGSHIAYRRVEATGKQWDTPIIRLHGGPGAYAVVNESGIAYYEPLRRDGFTMYFYDQIGGGLSARLDNPGEYTVMRHVQDLEAIRQLIGAEKIILFGESYGGTLAANYMATYPEHVEKAIFSSPGAINPAEWNGITDLNSPRGSDIDQRTQAVLYRPRFLTAYFLQTINPRAAHDFMPDSEIDGYWDEFVANAFPAMTCRGDAAAETPHGFGGWSALRTGSDFYAKAGNLNPRAKLVGNETPVLILKGECDHIKWQVTYQYKETFPRSTLIFFPGAGHIIYWDKPEEYLQVVRAFLRDEPLPLPAYNESVPPAKP